PSLPGRLPSRASYDFDQTLRLARVSRCHRGGPVDSFRGTAIPPTRPDWEPKRPPGGSGSGPTGSAMANSPVILGPAAARAAFSAVRSLGCCSCQNWENTALIRRSESSDKTYDTRKPAASTPRRAGEVVSRLKVPISSAPWNVATAYSSEAALFSQAQGC